MTHNVSRGWFRASSWVLPALLSGCWGALLGRLLFELFPLWFRWGRWMAIGPGLVCAVLVPLLLRVPTHEARGVFPGSRTWPLGLGLVYLVQPAVAPLWGAAAWAAGLAGVLYLRRTDPAPSGSERELGAPGLQSSLLPGRDKPLSRVYRWPAWVWDVAILGAALAVYVATLAPSVLPGDSGEFQLVGPTLGVPHPTGYPLYVVLSKLFSLLPLGSVAYRVNLLTAVAASIAVWGIYRAGIALQLRRSASLLGAVLLLVSDTFWSQATIAEKYALHAAFVALTLWLGLRWRAARREGEDAQGWLIGWACTYGLSLTHHRTMLLLAPAYLALVWVTDSRVLRPPRLWRPLAAGLLPLLLYALLPLFSALDSPYSFARIDSLRAFLDLVLARAYQGGLFRSGWTALPGRAVAFLQLLARQFFPTGLALALAGWVVLLRRERWVGWTILIGVGAQVIFALNYYVPNTPVYYLPAYVWLALCAAGAIDAVLCWLEHVEERAPRLCRVRPHLAVMWVLAVAMLPVGLCVDRWQGMDQGRAYKAHSFDYTYQQLALTSVEPGALIVSDWLPATVLWYGRWIEGRASGAEIVGVDSLEGQWKGHVEAALRAGRPVYLSRPIVGTGDTIPVASSGPLVRLNPPGDAWSSHRVAKATSWGGIELIGHDWRAIRPGPEGVLYGPTEDNLDGGSTLEVTLIWRATDSPAGDYAVTVSVVDAEGRVRVEKQARHPVGGTYPTSRWKPGEVVADSYRLRLPEHLPSGQYSLVAAASTSPLGADLHRDDVKRVALEEIEIQKPLRWPYAGLSVPVRSRCGDSLVLLGYDAPTTLTAGETADVAVQWLVTGDRAPEDPPFLYLVGVDGATERIQMWQKNPADWRRGAWVVALYTVEADEHMDHLELRGADWAYRLPTRLVAAPPPVADFGAIRLREYAYRERALVPGEIVHLTLAWEATADITERYKVFVHVLGQNGLPIAQQDNEPVGGTYPTVRWRRGERIRDPYAIVLPEALPAGEYAVEVGLYRISDLTRLPRLDRAQSAIDDKVYLEPIIVK